MEKQESGGSSRADDQGFGRSIGEEKRAESDKQRQIERDSSEQHNIVNAFLAGETAEQIAQNYDSVPLEDIYQVIGYYLGHRKEVDTYLRNGQTVSTRVRAENETRFPSSGIRERLLQRRNSKHTDNS